MGIYSEKITILKDICTPKFTAVVLIIARTWKQPRCTFIGEWIKKLRYIYTMEYYSAIKRNECESILVMWVNLETVIQGEISQKKKNKYHTLTHVYGLFI